ncbi:LLM class flavin-dependent oxidoreductase [Rhodococcus globerulus]|uniref:LLM class flavin-dependent oxidoreductase n=1 Tax=Rhodococcus globerulus TaxID=33008 RepID=UPI00374F28CB
MGASVSLPRSATGIQLDGGLPASFVFLSAVAQRTSGLRLGTGVVTLPLENPVRVAETPQY